MLVAHSSDQQTSFESVKTRLAEIAEAIDDENMPLDEALDLYEEAVALGLQASDLLETGVVVDDAAAEGAAEATAAETTAAEGQATGEAPGSPNGAQ